MARRQKGGFMFRVRETEVVNPERVAQGLNVWADYLARRLPPAHRFLEELKAGGNLPQ
ncbi:MAG TPA: hypothetical protein VD902_03300 [Symbiobacteriaceae bacterium]|nr:hypothetical protein [Symbiobacteriaceae bacterium]